MALGGVMLDKCLRHPVELLGRNRPCAFAQLIY
jgi:hypothetical protein